MKHIRLLVIGLLLLLPSFALSAQELNGYNFVCVHPLTYDDGTVDKYGLCSYLEGELDRMGFRIISEADRENPSSKDMVYAALDCIISHSEFAGKQNKVSILFKDVTGRSVWSCGSWGNGKTIEDSLMKAMSRVFGQFKKLKYHYDPRDTPKPFIKKKLKPEWAEPKPEWNEEAVRAYLDTCKNLNPIEGIYKTTQNDRTKYFRIGVIKDGMKYRGYILETNSPLWENGEVKCSFEPASSGLYSVTWYMSNKRRMDVFGKLYGTGLLSIEISDDTNTSQEFVRIYPPMGSSSKTAAVTPSPSNGNKSWQPTGGGSGFFVSRNGYVVTNHHVIKDVKDVNVAVLDAETGTYKRYTAEVRVKDSDNDIAILRIDDPEFKPLESLPYTIETSINIGASVFTIGYPLDGIMGENYKVTNGIISAKTGYRDNVKLYQITVPIQPGNSGGPLFDKNGNVVGITTSILSEKAVKREYNVDKVENVNYAVKSLYLLTVIDSLPVIDDLPSSSSLEGKSLEEQIKVLKFYVCNILTR